MQTKNTKKNQLLKFISASFLTLLKLHACCKKFPALDNQHKKEKTFQTIFIHPTTVAMPSYSLMGSTLGLMKKFVIV